MKYIFLLLALVLAHQSPANTCTTSDSLTATGQTLAQNKCPGASVGAVQLSGTWVGSMIVQGSLDNTNWFNLPLVAVSSSYPQGSGTNSMTSNGIYSFGLGGIPWTRVKASSISSGTCDVALVTDQGAPPIQQVQSGAAGLLVQTAPTLTITLTATPTNTVTQTWTHTRTVTATSTFTPSNTPTPSFTPNCTTNPTVCALAPLAPGPDCPSLWAMGGAISGDLPAPLAQAYARQRSYHDRYLI